METQSFSNLSEEEFHDLAIKHATFDYMNYLREGFPAQKPIYLEQYLRYGYFPSRWPQRILFFVWVYFLAAALFAIPLAFRGGNLEVTLVILIFGALVYSGGYVAWKKEWVDWPGILCEPLYNLKMKRKFPELKREADQAYEAKIAQLQQSFDAETEELADIWDQERQTELQWKIKTGEKLTTVLEDINHSIDQQETTLATTQKITETTAKNLENVRQQRPAGFPVPHGRELDLQFYLHLHEILVTEQETAIGPAIKLAETRFENRENTMALGQLIENFRQTFIEELHNQNQLMEDLNDRIVSRLDKQIDLLDNLTGTVSRGMSDVTSGLKRMDDHLEKVNTTIADTNQLIKQSNEEIANDLNSLVDYANRREQRLTRR